MASTVTFGTATVNGPVSTDPGAYPMWVTDQTPNHTRFVYQLTSVKKWLWTLKFQDLTGVQKAALENYFHNTAQGPTNTFTYTHTDGQTYANCRFADTELQFVRNNGNQWDVTIRIESPNQVA